MPQLLEAPGLCRRCDWNYGGERDSARGLMINCSWYDTMPYVDEVKECKEFSLDARLPSESRQAFEVRRHGAAMDARKFDLAERADRRARWALVVSILALLVSLTMASLGIWRVLQAANP